MSHRQQGKATGWGFLRNWRHCCCQLIAAERSVDDTPAKAIHRWCPLHFVDQCYLPGNMSLLIDSLITICNVSTIGLCGFNKIPQIFAIIKAKSTKGLSLTSLMLELTR